MKTRNFFFGTIAALATLFFVSCEDNNVVPDVTDYGILPERFAIDIPSSISNENVKSASLKSTASDTLSGNEIYVHLTNFISIGEASGQLVEDIIWAITIHKIDRIKELTYVSDEDGRVKHLVVNEVVDYEGRTWEYQLTVTDQESEGNEDGGIGMQVFWNKSPIAGIAVIKPRNMNRNDAEAQEALYRIHYSEEGTDKYEATMMVEIANVPIPSATQDPFAVDALKMFVGKKGDKVDVFGNSNHPNAKFNPADSEAVGFNWAFVASGYNSKNIGVAEVGLPANTADITSRNSILVENSIKTVLSNEITNYIVAEYANKGITLDPDKIALYIAPYLKNTEAPGYFNNGGFVSAGVAPSNEYTDLEASILDLVPYNPIDIARLEIAFK